MQITETALEIRQWSASCRQRGYTLGFVPTMGALHAGHISLVRAAMQECDRVVASIFVNPTQFNNAADLAKYPSTLQRDLAMLREAGCHAAFVPAVAEIYPEPRKDTYNFGLLSSSLEGHFRPGHFDGVLTVVNILLRLVAPHRAYFGEKDFQQWSLIRKMVDYERLDVTVVACPSVREPDGLAMSSRNMRLSPSERQHALLLSQGLELARTHRATHSPGAIMAMAGELFRQHGHVRLEYFAIVNPETFEPLTSWDPATPAIALVAAWAGEVRLIDNMRL